MNYHRHFIPLKSDSKGFELSGKEPLGRCLLEDRGDLSRLSLWVQDLKAKAPYKVVLILSDTGKYTGVPLGSLYVDGKGKGEFKTEFDSTGLADGQGLSRLSAVAVLAGGGGDVLCPLVGYKDGPVLWKNHFTIPDKGGKAEVKSVRYALTRADYGGENAESGGNEAAPGDQDESAAFAPDTVEPETGVQSLEDMSPEQETNARQDVSEQETNTQREEEEPVEVVTARPVNADEDDTDDNPFKFFDNDAGVPEYADVQDFFGSLTNYSPEEVENIRKKTDKIFEKLSEDVQSIAEEKSRDANLPEVDYDVLGDLNVIFDENIEINPFDTSSPDAQWVRISLKEPVYLPIDYRYLMNHPLIVAAYKKYNHLILGRMNNDGKTEYALGMPGIYEPQYVNAARMMGFTQFKTVAENGGQLRPGDYGYWLTPLRGLEASLAQ
ncbi:MAG: hypothetical protein LBS84_11830 [Clostridiales bacterium]|nr:hypothetical protein [Clostridiales bacterium]